MLKYCLDKWNRKSERLRAHIENDTHLKECEYIYLVKLVVDYILNDETNGYSDTWASQRITTIDNGDYQGTLLFLIPNNTYQPSEYEYLMTFVNYGSCSGCDALLSIQSIFDSGKRPTPREVEDYMLLCKDLVTNMIKPYNSGWRKDDAFEVVEM